jgi:hypothetical protein
MLASVSTLILGATVVAVSLEAHGSAFVLGGVALLMLTLIGH